MSRRAGGRMIMESTRLEGEVAQLRRRVAVLEEQVRVLTEANHALTRAMKASSESDDDEPGTPPQASPPNAG